MGRSSGLWGSTETRLGGTTAVTAPLPFVNVKDYGALGNRQSISNAAITTGTAILTSASNPFTAADVGKYIAVTGAGAAGAVLVTTIAGFTSAGSVTLTANASTSVSGAVAKWATDDTAAIQAAIDALTGGGTVMIPAGRYLVTGLTMSGNGVRVQGVSMGDTTGTGYGTMLIGAASMTSTTDLITVSGVKCSLLDLTLSGDGNGRDVIRLTNASQRFVGERLYIQNAGVGCGITHGTSVTSVTNKWANIYVASCGSHGIIVNSSDTEWVNVTTFSNGGDGLHCVGTAGNVANLHTWGNTGHGLAFASGGSGWRVANIYTETNTGNGIDLATATYNCVIGGVVRANAIGINYATTSKRNMFANLQIYNNTAQGVYAQGGDYCTLEGLHIFDDQGSKTQTYAIQIASGVTGTSIIGRVPIAADNLTGGLNDAGTATIINGLVTLRRTGDQSVTSSGAVANDDTLALAVGVGEVWEFDGVLFVEGSTAGDFAIRLNTPSVGSGYWQALGPNASAASTTATSILPTGQAFNTTVTLGMAGAAVIVPVQIRGLLIVGASGGTFNVKWAQGTSDGTATIVHGGSYLKCRRLA